MLLDSQLKTAGEYITSQACPPPIARAGINLIVIWGYFTESYVPIKTSEIFESAAQHWSKPAPML